MQIGVNVIDWKRVQEKRDMARRARRLAGGLLVQSDKERLLKYAEDLEVEADRLERTPLGAQ
jgi:hypothetical protein